MTTNETDELNLVQLERIQGSFNTGLYSLAPEGFSLQVFRDCHHIGSLNQDNGLRRLNLRRDDTILRINLGICLLPLSGLLQGQDGYTRQYEATLKIQVDDPKHFALSYVHQSDPVKLARALPKKFL